MLITTVIKDSNGVDLKLGDKVAVHDWGRNPVLLYVGTVEFDTDEMQLVITDPDHRHCIEDQFDLWHKAPKYKVIEDGE